MHVGMGYVVVTTHNLAAMKDGNNDFQVNFENAPSMNRDVRLDNFE